MASKSFMGASRLVWLSSINPGPAFLFPQAKGGALRRRLERNAVSDR
jgi:hypothetical protein